jgi:hypothetical protein
MDMCSRYVPAWSDVDGSQTREYGVEGLEASALGEESSTMRRRGLRNQLLPTEETQCNGRMDASWASIVACWVT